MAAVRVPAGAVLLTGDDVVLVVKAVQTAQRVRRSHGHADHPGWTRLAGLLSGVGQPDSPPEPAGDACNMTINEAAELLKCSPRTVRRQASGLGGNKVGGVWLLDPAAVAEHVAGASL